jgi:hypothetical protein
VTKYSSPTGQLLNSYWLQLCGMFDLLTMSKLILIMYQIIHPTPSFDTIVIFIFDVVNFNFDIFKRSNIPHNCQSIFVLISYSTKFEKNENAIQCWMEYLENKLMTRDKVLVPNWSIIKFLLIGISAFDEMCNSNQNILIYSLILIE